MSKTAGASNWIRFLATLDHANPRLLKFIPRKAKRTVVKAVVRAADRIRQSDSLEFEGVTIVAPGSTSARLALLSGNLSLWKWMKPRLGAGGTLVDVGANIGFFSLLAARRVGTSGRVVAVEPAAAAIRVLQDSIRRNNFENVTIHAAVAGAEKRTRDLYVRGERSGQTSLFPGHYVGRVQNVVSVPEVRIDDLIADEVDLVKIDVEGGELDVLRGMERTLAENQNIAVVAEWSPRLQIEAGHGPEELYHHLQKRGFKIGLVENGEDGWIDFDELETLRDDLLRNPRQGANLFAVREG